MADHCIVGAGPGGLAATRAFLAQGLDVDCFERHDDVGGIWDQDNPGSPMYDAAHFISSRSMSGFHGYPMPDDLPDYPSHRQVLAYLRAFARDHDLYRAIELGTGVEHAALELSLIHISEPTRLLSISYAVFCLKKKKPIHETTHSYST